MTDIAVVYASAPVKEVIVKMIQITSTAYNPIRFCKGYKDYTVTLDDEQVTFLQSAFDEALPAIDASGNQSLTFAIDNVTGQAQRALDDAQEASAEQTITYLEYLDSDLTQPTQRIVMNVVGVAFEGSVVKVKASYFDTLNTAWPREVYTTALTPGIRYL
jgi:hypothetical protein